jgi:large subunit ribosomal protein L15
MQTHQLKRLHKNMKRMIVARGGKRGKTAGRGGKGQSARAGNKRRPEWRDIIKRLPKLRGRGVSPLKSFVVKPVVINLDILEVTFSAGDAITPTILIEKGLVDTYSGRVPTIKILGDGEVTKAFKLSGLVISVPAKEKIMKAGGTVELVKSQIEAEKAAANAKAEVIRAEAKRKVEVRPKIESKPKTEVKVEKKPKLVAPKEAVSKADAKKAVKA